MGDGLVDLLLKRFISRWNKIIANVEANPMSDNELNRILLEFSKEVKTLIGNFRMLQVYGTPPEPLPFKKLVLAGDDIDQIRVMLTLSCAVSLAKWKMKNPSILTRLFSNLKQVNVDLSFFKTH